MTKLVLALLFFAVVVGGCASDTDGPPNVLLISVDTLRPDRLGYHGSKNPTSNNIDQLALESRIFTNAYSVSGWTLPSIASILTGRYPRDHGATDFHWPIDAVLPTMAGILKKQGYETRGYVSHVILKPVYGVSDGFDHFDFSVLGAGHPHDVSTAAQLTDLAIKDLKRAKKPFFFWVHYFDPHFEYLTHSEWQGFGEDEISRYDQEIANTDKHIARLLDTLKSKKLYDNTIIIFTADHGEEFGEHAGKYHYTMYEEVMRVPLLIKAPGVEAAVDESRVEQIDLLPTILQFLGIQAPGPLPGRNVLAAAENRPVFFERDRPPGFSQRGVLSGDLKLVVIEERDLDKLPEVSRVAASQITNVHPGIFMYDLSKDPGEKNDIYDEEDPRAQALLVKLAEHAAVDADPVREVEIDETLRKKLRSLGYIK